MTATPIEEKILLQQVADGDDKAFHTLYLQYHPRIYSLYLLSRAEEKCPSHFLTSPICKRN